MTPTQELIERLNKRAADCEDNARVCDLNDYDAEKALLEAEAADFRQAADRLASLSAELEALRGKLAGVDEKALEAGAEAVAIQWFHKAKEDRAAFTPHAIARAAIAAYLAAVGG